jgi:hypothetical protein
LSENSLYIAESSVGGRGFPPRGEAITTPVSICVISGTIDFSTRNPTVNKYENKKTQGLKS